MQPVIDTILSFKGTFLTLLTFIAIYYAAKFLLDRQAKGKADWGIIRSIIVFSIFLIGGIAVILALPMGDSMRSQITSLMGIVISAVLALSSATFIGNGLAGIMLRTINSFKPGDFIHVEGHFGRITERGLFHTEIQTENRDLTTLPNMFLTMNPVKVTRPSGTFISGICSLGYDVNRQKIEKALLDAADRAGLKDAFVRITELGDFSVVYKVTGMVEEIKTVLSAQSKINAMMLDALHDAGIEIVSPNFMNQRQTGDTVFIPKKVKKHEEVVSDGAPESKIFDKAEEAESIEKRKENLADIEKRLEGLNAELKAATEEQAQEDLKKRIEKWTAVRDKMAEKIDVKLNEISGKK